MATNQDAEAHLKHALANRYRIEREIGSGGMATVYLARDLRHEREVAVKVLRPELAAALAPERFLREIRIAANLNHPHILPVFDSGEADGFLYYVMPYEEGQSLRQKLAREGELPVGEAVRLLRDVVDALAHAHAKGVVHRDIKPDNVLLSGRHALVTDFGVAKAVSEVTGRDKLTTVGVALGTPAYMAPEQAVADEHIDHRADIYAVGVLGYELLTGRPPFLGTTPQMVLSAHVTQAPEPVTKYREAVPQGLEQLVLKCLEKKAADRWQSAEALLAELEALATPSGGVTPTETTPLARRRPRWKIPAIAAAAVVVAVAAVAITMVRHESVPTLDPERVVVVPLNNRTGDPSLDPIGEMTADWLTEGLLTLTGIIQPVPSEQVLQLLQGQAGGSVAPEGSTQGLARATGAVTVVLGSYYIHGDSLELQAQVLDATDGEVLDSTEPVRGPVQDPGTAIGLLRQRVTSILAARFDPLARTVIPAFERPPSLEALQAHTAGVRAYVDGDFTGAIRELDRALELDPTYVRASVMTISAYSGLGQPAAAESLAVKTLRSPGDLSPYDRLRVEHLLAGLRGDLMAGFRAARAAAGMVPGGTIHYGAIGAAVSVNRPREALEISGSLHVPEGLGGAPLFYYDGIASAHHILDEHREEQLVARRAREDWPGLLPTLAYEVRALAALGDMEELSDRIEECLALRPERGWTPGDVIRIAAGELVVHHGHSEEAQAVLHRAYEWHESQSSAEAQSESGRFDLAQTLYLDGRLDEAEGLFAELAEEFAENVDYLGYLGGIAARRGDREKAHQIDQELRVFEQPYIRGQHTMWRARIASLLGARDEAVALMREALGQGVGYGPTLHADPDFEPLWGYPPYEELMRPKG